MHTKGSQIVRMHKSVGPSYDVPLMKDDLAIKGWMQIDLARRAGVSHMTVHRFLSGERQTARTVKRLATALGYSVRRYLISSRSAAA